ncbi:hypothetical protein PTTG_12740 [Puccinia triticina 1-1 BBBD Race 1]|uniref:Integrase_H2C2 domain-containing protein n=1 Tax=Puccinia triticina (isolate 1-1 / race 1 (BBBD)) TaxID=630390 RepID=A0A180G243_PUCT1|nr:hypothetical protein PTTG_12740 [Puccinia triticina 1-1 BBBD Race 1]
MTRPRPSMADCLSSLANFIKIKNRLVDGYNNDPFCSAVRTALPVCKDYTEFEGLLFVQGRLVIPEAGKLRERLIADTHKDLGHPGLLKTVERLREIFFWPRMTHDAREFFLSQPAYQLEKMPAALAPFSVTSPVTPSSAHSIHSACPTTCQTVSKPPGLTPTNTCLSASPPLDQTSPPAPSTGPSRRLSGFGSSDPALTSSPSPCSTQSTPPYSSPPSTFNNRPQTPSLPRADQSPTNKALVHSTGLVSPVSSRPHQHHPTSDSSPARPSLALASNSSDQILSSNFDSPEPRNNLGSRATPPSVSSTPTLSPPATPSPHLIATPPPSPASPCEPRQLSSPPSSRTLSPPSCSLNSALTPSSPQSISSNILNIDCCLDRIRQLLGGKFAQFVAKQTQSTLRPSTNCTTQHFIPARQKFKQQAPSPHSVPPTLPTLSASPPPYTPPPVLKRPQQPHLHSVIPQTSPPFPQLFFFPYLVPCFPPFTFPPFFFFIGGKTVSPLPRCHTNITRHSFSPHSSSPT